MKQLEKINELVENLSPEIAKKMLGMFLEMFAMNLKAGTFSLEKFVNSGSTKEVGLVALFVKIFEEAKESKKE
jgi:hypothetical protein